MNKTNLLLGLVLISFCCITYTNALKCYYCKDKQDCKKPQKVECSPFYANATRSYLDIHHKNVNLNATSRNYDCFREDLKLSTGEYQYRSCIYNNIRGCDLPLRDHFMTSKYERRCNQCNNRDGCNPASRANISILTIFSVVMVALFLKHF